jgi:Fe-S-cluster-containing dehydrogenase component
MTRYGMLIDIRKCNGCYNCFLSCRDEYAGNDYPSYSAAQPLAGQNWMRVEEIERGTYPRPKLSYMAIPCQQCQSAPCLTAAQNGAAYRRKDGIVMIDPEKAKGQEAIAKACPYRAIFWNAESQLPQKCTFCAHRLDEGAKEPRCVEACPTGALVFGDLDDPNSAISKAMADAPVEALHAEFGTKPTVQYIAIPKRFILGEVVLKDKVEESAAGVTVELEGPQTRLTTKTNTWGDFEFEGLPKNTAFRLTVKVNGYATKTIDVVTRSDVNVGEVVLTPIGK